MDKLSIKINIGGRIYPMKIERDAEEGIRKTVKKIEERMKYYQRNYAIKDKQDLLAMCLIEFASKYETVNNKKVLEDDDIEDQLKMLNSLLADNI
jgi:cell division protein ZapA|tara:strand:- start:205 stop:489 length:285 start_codon:yes stop_codon:yes gene_type:complete